MFSLIILIAVILGIVSILTGILYGLPVLYARRMRKRWDADGRHVQFAPVAATCSSLRARKKDSSGTVMSVVGVADNRLVFKGLMGRTYDLNLPVEQIRWLGLRRLASQKSETIPRALVVHFEEPGGWQAYTLTVRHAPALGDVLSDLTGLSIYDVEGVREGFGPAEATRMHQDIYGQWQADFTDRLYLAPDRLLFAWRDAIMLDAIQGVDVIDRPGLLDRINPLAADLLRITYTDESGQMQVIGFQVQFAQKWGAQITQHAHVPFNILTGRKKKEKSGDPGS